jgi:TonB-linked SusC/RagA family outer membrane protein
VLEALPRNIWFSQNQRLAIDFIQPNLTNVMNLNSSTITMPCGWRRRQIFKVMKLTTLLIIVALVQTSAKSYSQKINLNEKNASLEKVFETISSQSGYHFFYDEKDVNNKTVTVQLKNASIASILDACFKEISLNYKIIGKNVIIKHREDNVAPEPQTISGRVTDESGNGMPGVTIRVKGSKTASVTQKDGTYVLFADKGNVLLFSYVGYVTKELSIGDAVVYYLSMVPSSSKLDQVVVIGYGTTKRKDLTGSISSVNINEVKDIPFASIDQALAGKAAGVQVVSGDGSPGGVASIRIRGGTSILGGNDPLYIIDGVQITPQDRYIKTPGEVVDPIAQSAGNFSANGELSGSFSRGLNSLAGLNINDIETIDILKDASATAIYGSKAANGVIIITTKKGKYDSKPLLELNNYTGVSTPIKAKLLNADQYKTILKEAAQNLATEETAQGFPVDATPNSILNDPGFLGNANTDWLKLVLRNGLTQNTDISIRGGGKSSRYYTSLSYTNQTGVVKGTDFKRLSGKINFDNEINSKLRIINNILYGATTNNITNGAYSQALYAPPTRSPYNADGTLATLSGGSIGSSNYLGFQNPLSLLNGINQGKNASFQGSMALEYDILKNLRFRSQASINYNSYHQRNYTPSSSLVATPSDAVSSKGGVGSQGQTENTSYLYENTLSYNQQFDKNNRLDVVAGTSWQLDKTTSFQASGQTYPDDFILNNLGSAALTLPNTSSSYQNSLLSFYARANYAYKDKYLLTVTARSDASSKFASSKQVGYFPSAGAAWRISQESFMKRVSWVDDLKLRASIGYTGTQNIGNYMYRTLYTAASYNGINATIPTQLGNNSIKWESTLQKDAGIDFTLFKSRLNGTVGIYEKKSSGLLYTQPLPASSSFSTLTANLADIRNRGLEIEFNGEIIKGKNFSWRGDLNVSFNRSLVTNLNSIFADPNHGSVTTSNGVSYISANTVLKSGLPVGQFVGLNFQGIIQNKEQLAAYQAQQPFYSFFTPYLNIGDPIYALTPDGFADNYQFIGSAAPKFYGGYTNTFTYKDFSLSTLFNYSVGGHILYLADIGNQYVNDLTNKGVAILDRRTPENINSNRPRLIYGYNAGATASNNIYSSSFLKLKSVSLNYRLPKRITDRLNIQSFSVYASATNLFTITKYPGQDPEVSNDPYSLVDGYTDANTYPTIKQYVMGIRLTL